MSDRLPSRLEVAKIFVIGVGTGIKNAYGQLRKVRQKNCNWCAANKLGCSIGSICVAKWKRAEGLGAKPGKEPKQA